MIVSRHKTCALALALSTAFPMATPAQGSTWVPLLPTLTTAQPVARRCAAMAYDSARDRIVMCAGRLNIGGSASYPQETWEFDGTDWRLIGPVGPIAFGGYNDSTNVRAYYDSQRQVTVAIESAQGGPTNFLEWNGANWTNVLAVPQSVFPWRFAFDVAYDPVRGVAVLFGGYNGSTELGDTWEFDGTTFTQVSGMGPMPRWGHAMAYDAARGVVMLHGGRNGPQLADMWQWNGTSWQAAPNGTGAGPRAFHGMGYDAVRSRLVMFGNDGGTAASETWEWQPSGWTQIAVSNPSRSNMAVVFDDLRGRIVSYGGTAPALMSGPTATFGYGMLPHLATITSFGVGCAGPAGVPALQATTQPSFGTTLLTQISNVPPGPLSLVFGWIGFDNTTWNGMPLPASLAPLFPGCTAYLDPVCTYSLGIGVNGSKAWNLPIPFMPALSGLPFYLQGGVYVPTFNPGQVVFTNALEGTLGV